MAKTFGIRVRSTVRFGPTIWSRHKRETEYGVKAVPFGGDTATIGMFPPGPDGKLEARSTSPWRGMIEDARSAAFEELRPGDEKRLFYTRASRIGDTIRVLLRAAGEDEGAASRSESLKRQRGLDNRRSRARSAAAAAWT
ncbi:hypothetical protein SALBM217S_00067 [Streptomyces griseoloalbus]